MREINFKALLPHFIAIVAFLVITLIYFGPLLQGKELLQHDVLNHVGTSKDLYDYRETKGEEALWTNSMFSGMPGYQVSALYPNNWYYSIHQFIHTVIPHPSTIIFLCLIGFYFLLVSLRVHPLISALGAFVFAFSSYTMISIATGHNPKCYAFAYMIPVIIGTLLTFRGKYLLGTAITAFSIAIQISVNHVQITYYFLILLLIYGFFEAYKAIQNKAYQPFLKSVGCLLIAAILGILPNITGLWVSMEYAKESTRGVSELTLEDVDNKTGGLDKSYATQWSYGIGETMTFMIPNFKGGSSSAIGDNKTALKEVDPSFRQNVAGMDSYFGDQPFTSGPAYLGAIVCFLFLFGLFIIEGPLKWWLLSATLLSVMLAWGKNFMPFTEFFLDYVPGYNKFRAVTMTHVIALFTIPLLGILALKKVIDHPDIIKEKQKQFFIVFGLTGGLSLVMYLFPDLFNSFFKTGEYEKILSQLRANKWPDDQATMFLNSVESARKNIFTADAIRSFIFILFGAGLIWLYSIKKFQWKYLVGTLFLLCIIDLWSVDKRYLNDKNFVSKNRTQEAFKPTSADLQILQDKHPNYRVFNLTLNPFSDASTSYFHKSLGGYHGAKMKRYQELIDYHISKNNIQVLNMLNTKYFIVPGENKQPIAQNNPEALGNAWFVKEYKLVANADSEIVALNDFNSATTAIIDKRYENLLESFTLQPDSTAEIFLKEYDLKKLVYESNAGTEQLAVFSEVFYDKGWKAYIDGKFVPHFRVNYILRAARIPAGKHIIEFKFEPEAYYTGQKISIAGSILLLLVVIGAIALEIKKGILSKSQRDC